MKLNDEQFNKEVAFAKKEITQAHVICVYCKEREAKKHSNPPCCDSKKCFEHWNGDRMSFELDCLREQRSLYE